MRALLVLSFAVFLAVAAQEYTTPAPEEDFDDSQDLVKNDTAAGHRHHRRRDDDDDYYYGRYGGYGGYGYGGYLPAPPLEDNNVCDFDASVLLVVGHRRDGRRNNARRVRCAEIANQDDDSCNVCCQQAARRDSSIQNSQMFGFLAVTDKRHGDKSGEHHRNKRHANSGEEDQNELGENIFYPTPQYSNVKCMCCAPKRALGQFSTVGAYGQQTAAASPTAYGQPIYTPPTPSYQAAAPAETYQAPAPAQTYQAPAQTYQAPAQAYQAPAQTYQAPAQTYQAPAPAQTYQAPAPVQTFQAPVQTPSYNAPTPVQSSPSY